MENIANDILISIVEWRCLDLRGGKHQIYRDLLSLQLTCKNWKSLIQEDVIWSIVCNLEPDMDGWTTWVSGYLRETCFVLFKKKMRELIDLVSKFTEQMNKSMTLS